MGTFDRELFHAINGWPDSWAPFFIFFSKGLDQTSVRIFFAVLLISMLANRPTRRTALIAGVGWILANGLTDLWKKIPFMRPGNELSDAIIRIPMSSSMGTASAHSANMAFIAFVFVRYTRWWGVPWVIIALLTGFSRIYIAAHYPSQVLLGWMTGLFAAWLVCWLTERQWPIVKPTNPGSDQHSPRSPGDESRSGSESREPL